MSALRKTTPTFTTPETDMFSGHGAELFTAGVAPSVDGSNAFDGAATGLFTAGVAPSTEGTRTFDGAATGLFTAGVAPSTEGAQVDGVLSGLFSSGS